MTEPSDRARELASALFGAGDNPTYELEIIQAALDAERDEALEEAAKMLEIKRPVTLTDGVAAIRRLKGQGQ